MAKKKVKDNKPKNIDEASYEWFSQFGQLDQPTGSESFRMGWYLGQKYLKHKGDK